MSTGDPMRILICVKQVRESADERAAWILNPADACALEAALSLRDAQGGEVTALTMGRPSAEGMLRELLARGTDRAVLITDPVFAGSDTLVTARVLAAAVRHIGPFDMIFAGRRAVDGETAETPARLAALLELPIVTDVTNLVSSDTCETEGGDVRHTLRFTSPAVLTFREGGKPLRPASLAGLRRSRKAAIEVLTNRELGFPEAQCGLSGSPTRVSRVYDADPPLRHVQWLQNGSEVLSTLRHAMAEPRTALQPKAAEGRICGSVWVLCERPDADAYALAARALALTTDGVRILSTAGSSPEAAADRIRRGQPAAVFCVSTPFLRVFASQTATLLETGLTADCTDLQADPQGLLLQIRPTFGGARMAEILCPAARPQMALVRSGVLPASGPLPDVPTEALPQQAPDPRIQCTSESRDEAQGLLRDAELVIAGGAGIGSAAGFERLGKLARALGGECAASRAAVDAGYAVYPMQIGQTGITLRPKVYLAFGISGAIQHVLGMRDAGTVIAVNTDPKAPVFSHADYGVAGNWETIVKEMEALL